MTTNKGCITFNNIQSLDMKGVVIKADKIIGTNIGTITENPSITTSYSLHIDRKKTLWGGMEMSIHQKKSQFANSILIVKNTVDIEAKNIYLNSLQVLSENGPIKLKSNNLVLGYTKETNDIIPHIEKKGSVTSITIGTQETGTTTSFISLNNNIIIESQNINMTAPKFIGKEVLIKSKNKIKLGTLKYNNNITTSASGFNRFNYIKAKHIQSNEACVIPYIQSGDTILKSHSDIYLESPTIISNNLLINKIKKLTNEVKIGINMQKYKTVLPLIEIK
jgi:hypothetical protein